MKKLFYNALLRFGVAALLIMFTPACSKQGNGKDSNIDHWTCTMHPSVHAKDPGKCPICGMQLVPVMKTSASTASPTSAGGMQGMENMPGMSGMKSGDTKAAAERPREFVVPVERQQQIGVTYATVETKPLLHTIRAIGRVMPETQRVWRVVSRTSAYVQELGVNAPGETVKKNQVLMKLYSPELLTTQRELIDLLRTRDRSSANAHSAREDFQGLIESAERRLKLWNITDEQIAEIERTKQPQESLPILSQVDGVVQSLPVTQGANVAVGSPLVEVADLSVVWVWGEFYQDELPMLKVGQEINVTSSSYPGEKFGGQITLVDPFIDPAKRTGRVRADIQNPELKLKPDMYVDLLLEMDMGRSLVVPVSAVMPTGERNIAFVDKGEGKLEPRFLELGGKYGDVYAVKSGLSEGERVVASANFLIDAESKIQGALKSW
ncbi:MAG TPA: efflux RND transporter periplasmic adaptor subunit [Pyrinomonadaceae bacterium]|jgi:Cu(I)/Ag(I) efflux system membrane fusion protein|nr:efflux RND transporter periplasmic adaptor subunit [Pyrinomonadaceae bacterium]